MVPRTGLTDYARRCNQRHIGPIRGYVPPPLTPLVRSTGICPLPSRHWSDPRVYAPSPHAIGPIRGYMPPPLTPLVRSAGIRGGRVPGTTCGHVTECLVV
eukprot:1194675-Prorocentrum_minimum.AAC.4